MIFFWVKSMKLPESINLINLMNLPIPHHVPLKHLPRTITKLIRQSGSMLGKLLVQGSTASNQLAMDDPNLRNLAAEVSRELRSVFQ